MNLADKVQEAIKKRIAELKDAQYRRASVIEKALCGYEKNIRIRSVSDYISLSVHQRRLMGLPDRTEVIIDLEDPAEIKRAEKKAEERLKRGQ